MIVRNLQLGDLKDNKKWRVSENAIKTRKIKKELIMAKQQFLHNIFIIIYN